MHTISRFPHAILLLLLLLLLCPPLSHATQPLQNVDDSGLALQGYDPVSYHLNSPAEGMTDLALSHDGITYLFSSPANRELFMATPDAYLPAYGGWCAWAMLEGEKVDVDPETFKIVEGRTLLFYNSFFSNTLKSWNELAESETEDKLTRTAESRWQKLQDE